MHLQRYRLGGRYDSVVEAGMTISIVIHCMANINKMVKKLLPK